MRAVGRILGRLLAVTFAYVIACIAAGLAVAGSIVVQAFLYDSIAISMQRLVAETLFVAGLTATVASVHAFAPAVVAIVVAEVFRIRRAVYHVLCGGLAAALGYVAATPLAGPGGTNGFGMNGFGMDGLAASPAFGRNLAMFVAAGLVGGFVYWLVAGRSAGAVLRSPA